MSLLFAEPLFGDGYLTLDEELEYNENIINQNIILIIKPHLGNSKNYSK